MRTPTKLNPCVITQGYHDAHHAVDLRAFMDDPVFAPEEATVTRVFVDPHGNHAIYLDGESGLEYRLFHAVPTKGIVPHVRIPEGAEVGRIVLDPESRGTHLHFEVLGMTGRGVNVGQARQNPIRWMRDYDIAYIWKTGILRQGEVDEKTA